MATWPHIRKRLQKASVPNLPLREFLMLNVQYNFMLNKVVGEEFLKFPECGEMFVVWNPKREGLHSRDSEV